MIINNDCLDEMRKMEDNSISCIITDPPYGLGFMGKEWDAGLPHAEIWKEALRIIKPGGHLLAFGGTRTYHRLTCAIEDAGWEIRDCLMWIYGSGFPKSHNHFGIEGFGTALKPAYEPIIMAMKPCDGTFAQNADKWGQAGINIDGCRIASTEGWVRDRTNDPSDMGMWEGKGKIYQSSNPKGRWPANVLFDEEAAKMLDEQSGISKSPPIGSTCNSSNSGIGCTTLKRMVKLNGHGDSGGASRFFYCAKTSSRERNEGLEEMPDKSTHRLGSGIGEGKDPTAPANDKNNHPTVKPLKLMRYLITLVMPPKDGILLDPFAGSGSTILAAYQLGIAAIGIEKSAEYCEIARKRLQSAQVLQLTPKEIPCDTLF